MYGTIESTHTRIIEKINTGKKCLESLSIIVIDLIKELTVIAETSLTCAKPKTKPKAKTTTTAKKPTTRTRKQVDKSAVTPTLTPAAAIDVLDNLQLNLARDELETVENEYSMAVIDVLSSYYDSGSAGTGSGHGGCSTNTVTKTYYRILSSDNFVSKVDRYLTKTITSITIIQEAIVGLVAANGLSAILIHAQNALSIVINQHIEKKVYEMCKCGARMTVKPERSELHCDDCGKIKDIIGAVFRDDQFYPQEGNKTKHGGYDTSRHYRFHIERLQALENKTFDETMLSRIEDVIRKDKYDRRLLNCETMRDILRDPRVTVVKECSGAGTTSTSITKGTKLNDHAPLLVKLMGGPAPPHLSFQENKLASIRFSKIMHLYEVVVPSGGNKPYYPYFIFKIFEHMFAGNTQKLRLLDYIHLQSRDTVIKHDKIYEQICAIADPDDGLVYTPTDRNYFRI